MKVRTVLFIAFKLFATLSILIEIHLFFIKDYFGRSEEVVKVNHQLIDFIGKAPIKEIKVYKNEKDLTKNNYTPLDLYWSNGFKGFCSLNGEFTHLCKNEKAVYVDRVEPEFFRRWRGGVFIWIERYREEEIKRKRDQENCAHGWKHCGFNLCVKLYDPCPVTDLKIDKDIHYNKSSEEYTLLEVKEDKVLVVHRKISGQSDVQSGFINDLTVTMNTLPCRARNTNGTKLSDDTTLDLFTNSNVKCDEKHPELIENFKNIDGMNRRKLNEFNLPENFLKNLPVSEAVKYKKDEMLLSGSIYSIKSTKESCDKASPLQFASKVSDHSDNNHRLRSVFYVKAALYILVVLFSSSAVAFLGCNIGMLINYLLIQESSFFAYFSGFYTVDLKCFFNIEHFTSVHADYVEKPAGSVVTVMWKQGASIYLGFFLLFTILKVIDYRNSKKQEAGEKKEKDEGDVSGQKKQAPSRETAGGSKSPARKNVQRED